MEDAVGSSMLEALAKAGAISKDRMEREEALRSFEIEEARGKPTSESFSVEDLRGADTIGKFEHIAKTLLLAGSITTTELVRAGNALKERLGQTDHIQRLVALTYHLRDHLNDGMQSAEDRKSVRAAFRKAGSKFPDDEKGAKKKHR